MDEKFDLTAVEKKIFHNPILVLAIVTGSIFIAEYIVMLILSYMRPMSTLSEALVDSLTLIVLTLPLLYLMLLRPLKVHLAERRRLEDKLREASITDELTGLLNRRGFLLLSEQQCKVATRNKCGISLLYADLDNMKYINDRFGHDAGDRALMNTAGILKRSFRESDIIARIGGDEFAVFMTDNSEADVENTMTRNLVENLSRFNQQNEQGYTLSLSMGIARDRPGHPCPIDSLLTRADKLMYKQKAPKPETPPREASHAQGPAADTGQKIKSPGA